LAAMMPAGNLLKHIECCDLWRELRRCRKFIRRVAGHGATFMAIGDRVATCLPCCHVPNERPLLVAAEQVGHDQQGVQSPDPGQVPVPISNWSGLKSANRPSVDWRLERVSLAISGRDRAYSVPPAGTCLSSRPLRSARHLPRLHVPARPRRQEQMPLLPTVDPWWSSISDPS
jgi:hypothetical protein